MSVDSLTVAQMRTMDSVRPDLALFAKRISVVTYDDFISTLYIDLDECISIIEEDPKVRQADSEDRLTTEIISMLRKSGYDASHDETIGGHSDIVVRHFEKYKWVAEAKIHSSYDYLRGGYDQLTTRYLRGTPFADQGAFLIYNRSGNTSRTVAEWLSRLTTANLPDFKTETCPIRQDLGFYSQQKHEGSGRLIRIRHIGIDQYWNPKK